MKQKSFFLTVAMAAAIFIPAQVFGQDTGETSKTEFERMDSLHNVYQADQLKSQKQTDEDRMRDVKTAKRQSKAKAKEAKRVEREANSASRESKYALRAERKAQKSRRQADKQAEKASDARDKSDRN